MVDISAVRNGKWITRIGHKDESIHFMLPNFVLAVRIFMLAAQGVLFFYVY